MEVNDAEPKLPEQGRLLSVPLVIDLNETPVCSPRETVSGGGGDGGVGLAAGRADEVPPPPPPPPNSAAGHSAAGEPSGSGKRKGKRKLVMLDINALPSDGEGDDDCVQVVNSGTCGTSIGNSNRTQVTCSNPSYVENQFGVLKTSATASMTSIPKSVPVDTVQQRLNFSRNWREADLCSVPRTGDFSPHAVPYQNQGDMLLHALREYIFHNHGILEDGWSVEFLYCQNRCKTLAVFCSPDGNRFESMSDVARYIGLVSNSHSLIPQGQSDRFAFIQNGLVSNSHSFIPQGQSDRFAFVQNGLRSQKRIKESLIFSRNKDVKECQENLTSRFAGELTLGTKSMDAEGCKLRDSYRVTEANSEGIGGYGSSYYKDGFPLQFEDFFVLSVGKVDPRPSYHNTSQIWPVGYKSSWHDKITGSLFICDISDGGDCGPVFKVKRYPCSTQPIPIGSTVLSRSSTVSDDSKTAATFDLDDHEDIDVDMIFSGRTPPHIDFDVLSSSQSTADEMSNSQPVSGLKTDLNCISLDVEELENCNRRLGDDIGEFLVEGRSISSVWKMVSQNLVRACHEAYKKTGICKLCCTHDTCEWWPPCEVLGNAESTESTDSLAKFCHLMGPLSAPRHIQSNDELTNSCEALVKWLGQDRFGLDIQFVQEIIEQLPGVHACSDYIFLDKRSDKSKLQTVGSGFLLSKRKSDVQCDKETDRSDTAGDPSQKDFWPPGQPMSSKLPAHLTGDVVQSWELIWRFSEVLGLEEPLSFMELGDELTDCFSFNLGDSSASTVDGEGQRSTAEEPLREGAKVRVGPDAFGIHTGEIITKAHCSLLKILLTELQSKFAAFVDPTLESGESKSRKRRKKEGDNLVFAKKSTLDLLPVNELTWPELARRYVFAVSSTGGNLDSLETVSNESGKVFHCLQGHSGPQAGSLPRVAGMEADALLLAEATKQIFGSSKDINDHVDYNDLDVPGGCKIVGMNDGEIPEWALVLEPVRKLPTNVGARIRKRIYEALEKNPPDWARRILEHSISKQVYKGNASGPTKKAVLALLADVHGESQQQRPNRKKRTKNACSLSDVIMKQCRKVLRLAVAADEDKVFCNLLGRTLLNTSDNDDEGLLGFPSMVSRPLDFRTIDLRLAFGAYGGSHEAFLEDVREVWNHICTAYTDQPDLVQLAKELSQKFEELYENEVLTLSRKFRHCDTEESSSSESKKEMEEILERASDLPKAPWDEGVCKICGVDKDDDNVLLCDKCDSGYHTYCLNPPLARVPEGNWYCPSCVTSHCISQGASEVLPFNRGCRKKKHQGEFTHQSLETLSHLGTTMEVKDYWQYSLEERVFLLKFLGDEVLNSAIIREHLEQCAPISNDFQQKLRSLYAEWKNFKFREEILTEKIAKINATVLNGVGSSGAGRAATVLPNCDKLMAQQLNKNSLFLPFPTELVNRHSGNNNGFIFENTSSHTQPLRAEDEFMWQNKVIPILQVQKYDSNRDHAVRKSVDREAESSKRCGLMMPTCEVPQGSASSITFGTQVAEHARALHSNSQNTLINHPSFVQDVNELKACNVEANVIKDKISVLQDSIASLESQLQKASLRKEFLGRDSFGRLYWVFCRSGSSPLVAVDGTMMVQHKDMIKEVSGPSKMSGIPTSSWFSYQSDAEIEELIRWLRDNGPRERDLLESLSMQLRIGCKDSNKVGNFASDACQPPLKVANNDKTVNHYSFVTKASTALEKKYGPCFKMNVIGNPEKQNQNAEVISKEKMYRCECLEPIWTSRSHCEVCHWSFSSSDELKEHKDGKCCSTKNGKVNDDVAKGKAVMRTEQGELSGKTRVCKSGDAGHENGVGVGGSQKDLSSPYNIEEICSKFVVRSSNKELVREIGLLGSDGIPSLVPCASPYLSDPTLKLAHASEDEVDESEKSVASVPADVNACKKIGNDCKGSSISGAVDGIQKEAQKNERPNLTSEKKDRSIKFNCSKLGNVNFPMLSDSSLRPLVGRGAQILKQLKVNLLDMEAILPEEALKPSKACLAKQGAWRAYVKSAKSVFEMVQATIVLEQMIKTEYLRNELCFCSSPSAAAKIATVSSLALQIYTLDAAILYEKSSPPPPPPPPPDVGDKPDANSSSLMDSASNLKPSSKPAAVENEKPQSKSGKKRKDTS